MAYLFTSESVSEGHPDKIADQISDALIDNFLAWGRDARVAIETLVTTGQVVLAGEVKSNIYLDVQKITRAVISRIGYTKSDYMFEANSCGILSAIHEQSPDINQGVDRAKKEDQGAGDQGIMFGYATNETENYMPLALDISHRLLYELAKIRRENVLTYLRPDSKSQVTLEYDDDHKPVRIEAIVISTQHDPEYNGKELTQEVIKKDLIEHLIPRVKEQLPEHLQSLFNDKIKYHINPTGKFVIGGPHGDTGLTGRKVIVDTYGGKGAHGGGAFFFFFPSKVDRSASYATRHIAKNLVAAGIADELLVQVSYAIGVKDPVGVYVDTHGTAKHGFTDEQIAQKINEIFDITPYGIETRLKLRNPIYQETATYGHMGRESQIVKKSFENTTGEVKEIEVELFTWEKLDYIDKVKKAFAI